MTFLPCLYRSIVPVLIIMSLLVGCSVAGPSFFPQLEALNQVRRILELPDLPLEFVKTTTMVNSPSGNLKAGLYQDSEGRKFYVEPESNRVVEIDARAILSGIPLDSPSYSQEELSAKASRYFNATIKDFASLQNQLSYEAGAKGDNYFFTWHAEISPGAFNRPFAQIGLHRSGILFAYYNTLLLDA